jgi:hypothetical protein
MSAEYRALVDKVDAFVASTTARRRSDLHCQKGCEACCHVFLSVGALEAASVRAGLAALSDEARARVRTRGLNEGEREREQGGEARCAMLEDDGSCAIYAHRPLVCRSQGQALRYPADFVPEDAVRLRTKGGDVTWCPLNYTSSEPNGDDVLDAERVDQILAVVTRRQLTAADDALARTSLSDLAAESR